MTELAEPSSDLAIPSPLRVPVFVNSLMAAVHREPSVGLGSVLFAVCCLASKKGCCCAQQAAGPAEHACLILYFFCCKLY